MLFPDMSDHFRFATQVIHAGTSPHKGTGARVTPIFHTNGFVFNDLEHGADLFVLKGKGFTYSRGSNPTTAAFEARMAALEGGTSAIAIASGQSALLVILLTLCESGDEYVASRQLFGGSLGLLKRMDKRLGIKVIWADPTPESIAAAITPKTKAVLIETIVNPTGQVVDLTGISRVTKAVNVPLVVDNTLATPALLRPFEHGADILFHSASKFLCGSGTAIGGVIIDGGSFNWVKDTRYPLISEPWEDYDDILLTQSFPDKAFSMAARLIGLRELGPGLSPTNAFLILMGIETLPLRMQRHCDNAQKIAAYLRTHPAVDHVSLPDSTDEHVKKLCPKGSGSIFVATLKGGLPAATRLLSRLKLFSHLVNIGESRSLICHPATTTHKQMSEAERHGFGIDPGTLRFSIGLENPEDLIKDLEQGLK